MLKYKINIKDGNSELVNVKYDSLYYSPDTTYVTGVTSSSYGLGNVDYVYVETDNENSLQQCKVEAVNKSQCGYVIYNQKFPLQILNDLYCVQYIDGLYYCCSQDAIDKKISINNIDYDLFEEIIQDNGEITYTLKSHLIIPTKYYSYDNVITIDNVSYEVNIESYKTLTNDEDYYPYIILNKLEEDDVNRVLYVIDWEYSKRKDVTVFKIFINDPIILNITDAICVAPNLTNQNQWDNVIKSNFIDLYVSNILSTNINDMKLFIKSIKEEDITLQTSNDSNIFELFGEKYIINENLRYFVNFDNNKEYELYRYAYIKDGEKKYQYYIINGTKPIILSLGDNIQDEGHWPSSVIYRDVYPNNRLFVEGEDEQINNKEYNVISYEYVTINDTDYRVVRGEKYKSVSIKNNINFMLQIYDKIGSNVLRCYGGKSGDMSLLLQQVTNNCSNFMYSLQTSLFNENLISPLLKSDREYVASYLNFYVSQFAYVLPINFNADVANNLHEDFVIKEEFFNEKINESINRIVDMEKDVYYPARYEKNKKCLTLCHEILIDLHFRSRNLEEWTVNEPHMIHDYANQYPSTWNIFDAYRYRIDNSETKSTQPILDLKGDEQYFPPSDLLYFLNFTNEDVFYQKLKLSKSFLRLSFFDSPNPNTQNLLYTTTIFISESDLFAKYINTDKTQMSYITVKQRGVIKEQNNNNQKEMVYTVDNNNLVNRIGVDTEPLKDSKKKILSFDEKKRLSCSFSIKNRYESTESSEGFYLYLFKEYSNGMHERTIYLKVEFNHAGEGKTINFMQMYRTNNKGEKQLINWGSKYTFDKYKDGYSLQELYEHLYIEIKVKYDKENKRFCYYLPEWMSEKNSDKNLMRLSLFEVKIKDEAEIIS